MGQATDKINLADLEAFHNELRLAIREEERSLEARLGIRIDKKANQVGEYPNLFAGNLVGEKVQVPKWDDANFDVNKAGYVLRATGYDPANPENEYANGPATITEIRGRACAWNQLAPKPSAGTISNNGVTFTKNGDGSITVDGKATGNDALYQIDNLGNVNGMVYLKGCPAGGSSSTWHMYDFNASFNVSGDSGNGRVYNRTTTLPYLLGIRIKEGVTVTNLVFWPQLINISLLNPTLAAKANLTVAEVEAYLATLRTPKPYYNYNAGQLLGARMLGWSTLATKNLLDPETGKAQLFDYKYADVERVFTVKGLENLTGATIRFTPYNTGEALTVAASGGDITLDTTTGHFTVPSAGELSITKTGGDLAQVMVVATYDGAEDEEHEAYQSELQEFDTANIYHKDGNTYVQEFDGGILRAAGTSNDSPKDSVRFDEATQKWVAEHKVGEYIFTGNETYDGNASIGWIVKNILTGAGAEGSDAVCGRCILSVKNSSTYPSGLKIAGETGSSVEAVKSVVGNSKVWYALSDGASISRTNLYYKVGEEYLPMEQVFPDGIVSATNNWASESLVEQEEDNNGQPQSITPLTTETFSEDLKEVLRTIADTYVDQDTLNTRLETKLTKGDYSPETIVGLADNLASWAEDVSEVSNSWDETIRSTAGDDPIDTAFGGVLTDIVAKSDFKCDALNTSGYNLLRLASNGGVAVAVGNGWYFPVPHLELGAFGDATKNNGVLLTDKDGNNINNATVYFKALADGVPTGVNDGVAASYQDVTYNDETFRTYLTSGPGYLIVSGITYDDTCAHLAWEDWYDKYVSPTAEDDAGDSISLTALFTAAPNGTGKFLVLGSGGNAVATRATRTSSTQMTITDPIGRVTSPSWTNELQEDEETYKHSLTISSMKADGLAQIEGSDQVLTVVGTTVSYIDTNATAISGVVRYEQAAAATANVTLAKTQYALNDCGIEMKSGATGEAYFGCSYSQNVADALSQIAKVKLDIILSVVAEALLYLYNENKALRELLAGKDNAVLPVVKAQSMQCDDILTLGVPNVLYSSVEGAPSAVNVPDNWNEEAMTVWNGCPRKIGQQYVDKVSKKVYYAVAVTGSTSDWVVLN